MARPCTICTHDACGTIDQALVEGLSYRSIASVHGVSKSALLRHQEHRALETEHVSDHEPGQPLAAEAIADLRRQAASLRVQATQLSRQPRSYHEYPTDTLVVQMALGLANVIELLWPERK